jgi:hypothetical protein
MNKNYDKVFSNEEVFLDYSIWEKCLFIDCKIQIEYGIFSLNECEFRNCKLELFGKANNISKVILLFYPNAFPIVEKHD